MSSTPIKSTITVSNEQRPVVVSNSSQSTRTVVESVNTPTTDHSQDRRSSGSDKNKLELIRRIRKVNHHRKRKLNHRLMKIVIHQPKKFVRMTGLKVTVRFT